MKFEDEEDGLTIEALKSQIKSRAFIGASIGAAIGLGISLYFDFHFIGFFLTIWIFLALAREIATWPETKEQDSPVAPALDGNNQDTP